MIKSHIEKLKSELAKSKWIIHTDTSTNELVDNWKISKPNEDCLLTIRFTIFGNGTYDNWIGNETMDNACACSVLEHPEIDLYFGKHSGKFQKDLPVFISQLNALEKKDIIKL